MFGHFLSAARMLPPSPVTSDPVIHAGAFDVATVPASHAVHALLATWPVAPLHWTTVHEVAELAAVVVLPVGHFEHRLLCT